MTSIFKNRLLTTSMGVLLFTVALMVSHANAQEPVKIPPRSEYQYKKDYAQVQEIIKEADLQKRADMLMGFIKEHPESRMIPYVSGYYSEIVATHMKSGNWQKVIAMDQAYLALVPDDQVILPSMMSAYYQTKNLPKAAELGEKLYASSPNPGLASDLSQIYQQMNNTDKYMFYADKVVSSVPVDKSYMIALKLADIHLQRQEPDKALGYLNKVVDFYGEKIPPGVPEANWNTMRTLVWRVRAAETYKKKDYAKAIELYQKVAGYSPQNDEAYYYIGMAKWQSKDQLGAIEAFAKATVLNKTHAAKAKEYMEQLYKAEHSDSLDGIDEVLAKAKSDLGLS